MCSSLRDSGGQAAFARSRTAFTAARFLAVEDDEVTLGAAEPLRRLAALCDRRLRRAGRDAREGRLRRTGPGPGRRSTGPGSRRDRLPPPGLRRGAARPGGTLRPQDPGPLPRLAGWYGAPAHRTTANWPTASTIFFADDR
ncbi:hypothetical protein LUR56_17220 [Streptomyces sp. MT29]|nr:hypothetical protein [Streptomyces sp. MT29]